MNTYVNILHAVLFLTVCPLIATAQYDSNMDGSGYYYGSVGEDGSEEESGAADQSYHSQMATGSYPLEEVKTRRECKRLEMEMDALHSESESNFYEQILTQERIDAAIVRLDNYKTSKAVWSPGFTIPIGTPSKRKWDFSRYTELGLQWVEARYELAKCIGDDDSGFLPPECEELAHPVYNLNNEMQREYQRQLAVPGASNTTLFHQFHNEIGRILENILEGKIKLYKLKQREEDIHEESFELYAHFCLLCYGIDIFNDRLSSC